MGGKSQVVWSNYRLGERSGEISGDLWIPRFVYSVKLCVYVK